MAGTMYDFLSLAVPDYATPLSVAPSKVMTETGSKNQVIHMMDDRSIEVIDLSGGITVFDVELQFNVLTAAVASEIHDLYHDPLKANQFARTWPFSHPTDGHVYVARFIAPLPRSIQAPAIHAFSSVKVRVEGYVS